MADINTIITSATSNSNVIGITNAITWGFDLAGTTGSSIYVTNSLTSGENVKGYKRPSAKRISKKKPGDKTGKNTPDTRLPSSPMAFFKIVKGKLNKSEVKNLTERLTKVSLLIEEFGKSGQVALKEMLEDKFKHFIREQELAACGFTKFVTKNDLNKFICLTKRNIDMTPIKNYARVIPKAVLRVKNLADTKHLFDGYVVVHTSDGSAKMLTRLERKDPILFGIIENSDKLYFVADWEDELCDLKFSEIIDTLSKPENSFQMQEVDKELELVLKAVKE